MNSLQMAADYGIQKTMKKMDKDRFRQGLGDVVESYHQVADRLGMNIET